MDTVERAEGYHVPVMLAETLAGLKIKPDGRYLDATGGGGGHSAAILDKLSETGRLLVIDRDDDALAVLRERFGADERVVVHKLNFGAIGSDEAVAGFAPIDGILFDFGVSSRQIDNPERGFSFMQAGPLDMRMDRSQGDSAADVVNEYGEAALIRILREYGEEPRAKRIVQALVQARPVTTTEQLKAVVETVADPRERIKTLARVFQALRIEVNGEMDEIDRALDAAYELLAVDGRLAALSYHSLEDRRVKQFLRRMEGENRDRYLALPGAEAQVRMKAVPRKAVQPGQTEINTNPRARSARLRLAIKQN